MLLWQGRLRGAVWIAHHREMRLEIAEMTCTRTATGVTVYYIYTSMYVHGRVVRVNILGFYVWRMRIRMCVTVRQIRVF